jgi:ribosomal protein S1
LTFDWASALDAPTLSPGDIVEGEVVQIDRDGGVWIDCSPALSKSEVHVSGPDARMIAPELGARVKVLVTLLEDDEGRTLGSLTKAPVAEALVVAHRHHESGEPITLTVTKVNDNGSGILGDWGPIKVFVPRRYIADRVDVGNEIDAVILEVDDRKRSLVAYADLARDELFSNLAIGQVHVATVESYVSAGALVQLASGVRGFLPVAEMDNFYIRSVEQFISIGDRLLVQITALDRRSRKLTVSRQRALPEAWKRFAESAAMGKAGDVVDGRVTKRTQAGLIVRLPVYGVDGFVHSARIPDWPSSPKAGTMVKVRVLGARVRERRASLALAPQETAVGDGASGAA